MARRAPGTGSVLIRTDKAGRRTFYGKWSSNGRAVMRRLGPVRPPGTRDGLTRTQAEAELRRLMSEVQVSAPAGQRLTVEDVGERYLRHVEALGRKRSTV